MFDLLIANGLIVDGTGNPGYYGTVAIMGDEVTILRGDISGVPAARVLDASNRVVCPGFIDIHTHSGLSLLVRPHHEPKILQGVTTEVVGTDGLCWAPTKSREDLLRHILLNSACDGAPDLSYDWRTVEEFLSNYDRKVSCNVAYLVGNNPLRSATVGWQDRRATGDEIAAMKSLLRKGLEQGAFGLSSGLDYPPGSYADTAELVALCSEANKLGGFYHTHVRYSLGDRFIDPYEEAIAIGRQSGIPVHITHIYQRVPVRGGYRRLLDLVDCARRDGMDVTFDNQPYPYLGGTLVLTFPQWARNDGPEAFLQLIASKEGRRRIEKELVPAFGTWSEWWLTGFERPENRNWEGRSVADIVQATGKSTVDALCDLLVEEQLHLSYVVGGINMTTLPLLIQHPAWMLGSDCIYGGEAPNPRAYGAFPFILGNYVREDGFLTLTEAIRKMTSAPAQRLGLKTRGLLHDGFKADITVFDPETVHATATRLQPRSYPVGIDYVIVNGTIVADHGRHTGAVPGVALRRGRD